MYSKILRLMLFASSVDSSCCAYVADLSLLRDDEFDDRCCGEDVLFQFHEKRAFVELSAEQNPRLPQELLEQLLNSAARISGSSVAPIDLTSSSTTACDSRALLDTPRVLVRLWVEELEPNSTPYEFVSSRTTLLDVGAELAAASLTLPLSALARYLPPGAPSAASASDAPQNE